MFEPAVQAGVEQEHFAFASAGQTALAVGRSATPAGRAQARAAEKTTEGFAAQGKAFGLTEFLAEMVIVEAGIARAGQSEDAGAQRLGKTARAGTAAADLCQSRCAALPIARFEPFDMARRESEQLRGSGTRQSSLARIAK
jgi:hypothetical protein